MNASLSTVGIRNIYVHGRRRILLMNKIIIIYSNVSKKVNSNIVTSTVNTLKASTMSRRAFLVYRYTFILYCFVIRGHIKHAHGTHYRSFRYCVYPKLSEIKCCAHNRKYGFLLELKFLWGVYFAR